MTIQREDSELVAVCDECGDEFPGGVQNDFRAFVQELKEAGWKIKKEDDCWLHICPECQD